MRHISKARPDHISFEINITDIVQSIANSKIQSTEYGSPAPKEPPTQWTSLPMSPPVHNKKPTRILNTR
jgi:hypothetical protein